MLDILEDTAFDLTAIKDLKDDQPDAGGEHASLDSLLDNLTLTFDRHDPVADDDWSLREIADTADPDMDKLVRRLRKQREVIERQAQLLEDLAAALKHIRLRHKPN
jgi:hypothetical protein